MQWFNSTLNSNTEITFSSPNSLSSNLSVMTSVYPETLNSTILKLTNSILQLEPGTYRIESVLKISYATLQASPIEFYLQEIDTNGADVANS